MTVCFPKTKQKFLKSDAPKAYGFVSVCSKVDTISHFKRRPLIIALIFSSYFVSISCSFVQV